jgi:hypothetical protein
MDFSDTKKLGDHQFIIQFPDTTSIILGFFTPALYCRVSGVTVLPLCSTLSWSYPSPVCESSDTTATFSPIGSAHY